MNKNNFARKKECVILCVKNEEDQGVLTNSETGEPLVFSNYKKALQYASRSINTSLHKYLVFVNKDPVEGAGDEEDTHGRRCLRCHGPLVLGDSTTSRFEGGDVLVMDTLNCPKCDKGSYH